ncbi:MAG: HAMP domain-containing histidine kinase [Tissierellia bacterium]|nr:HAMP domain-containing histidine kinase [Tissierellia bacterium]
MKLSRKLNLSFIIAILISIAIISITSTIMINNRFEVFLIRELENKFQRISNEINELFTDVDSALDEMDLLHFALTEDINLKIVDNNNKLVYNSDRKMGMGMHGGMMNRSRRIPTGNYIEKSYPLLENDTQIGTLIIGYIDNSYLTDSALIFKDTLRKSIMLSSFITIILGILISMYLSKNLTAPLVNIRDTAVEIRQGNLQSRSSVDTNTLEIKDLSDSINYLGETLIKEENSRKAYASDISHELRTPLTTLKTHLEAMLDGVWEANEEHLNILLGEIDRLSNFSDDLRDSFKAKEYNIDLNKTSFNVSKELKDIIKIFKPIYSKDNYILDYSFEDDIEINFDRDKFNQIINNLLTNSKRYLGDNGKVIVDLKKDKKNIRISISDNGTGIKPEDLPHILDRFYRVDSSRNKGTGGSGLGLSIVKSLVEAHGGTININSVYGEGTEVDIILPYK